jgi:hypothetical protein
MILFWCLCVSVLLIGLALDRQVRAALADLWLHLFGARVRAPSRSPLSSPQGNGREQRPAAPLPVAPPSRYAPLPPPQVTTHMVPRHGP